MIELSLETIRAAADNDLSAIAKVLSELEPRICQISQKYALRNGRRDDSLYEDLQQEGRIRAWRCLETFKGSSVGEFFAYVDRYVSGDLDAARRAETRQGVSPVTARRFEVCLTECNGDPYAAEKEAQRTDGALSGQRLSPEMAYAARVAWQGTISLDAPVGESEPGGEWMASLLDLVSQTVGVPVDLLEASDTAKMRREAIRLHVHATLARMGRQQAFVLRATYGVAPVGPLDEAGIAEALSVNLSRVRVMRSKGKDRFRELYLAGASVDTYAAAA